MHTDSSGLIWSCVVIEVNDPVRVWNVVVIAALNIHTSVATIMYIVCLETFEPVVWLRGASNRTIDSLRASAASELT